jgi:outer membrane protein assembly factor BamD (BamD/ComL family)
MIRYRAWIKGIRTELLAAFLGLLLTGGCVSPVRACISDKIDSVHFHSALPDFGIPPRRAILSWRGEHDDRPSDVGAAGQKPGVELESRDEEDGPERRQRSAQRLTAIEALEDRGTWREARLQLEQAGAQNGWTGILRDRVQLLRRIERMPTVPPALLAAYRRYRQGLDADEMEQRDAAQDAFEQVYRDPAADFLRAHACYQLASLAWEWLDFPRAVRLYQGLLHEFPQSARREDALIMLARCALLPATETGRDLGAGRAALDQLAREFPKSRFRAAALGLRGRLHYINAEYSAAFWCYRAIGDSRSVETMLKEGTGVSGRGYRVWLFTAYLRRLTQVHTYTDYAQTISAIDRTRYALAPQDLKRFAALLRQDPELPDPYLYYRLYHTDLKPSDLKSLAQLADAIVAAHPATRLSAVVQVRLAEVYYRQRQYDKALHWATDQTGAERPYDRALYVRGATLQKLGRSKEALAAFRTLLARCPLSPLRHGAWEETAILCEALGDRIGALEQYFALDYTADIAYLLDSRMSISEVEACLRRFRRGRHTAARSYYYSSYSQNGGTLHYSERELLTYTLGVLELRADHWDAAERWFKQLKSKRLRRFSQGRTQWATRSSPDPLTAARDLRRLSAAVKTAPDDNARASALYKVATYYYTHGTLLLYNSLLWQNERAWDYGFILAPNRKDVGDAATRAYMYRHEVYARVLALCKQIAERYPNAPVAPQALYRAACSARFLANFNGWWRAENHGHNHWREATRLMHLCAVRYPHHPLAKEAAKYAQVFEQERKDSWDDNAKAYAAPMAIKHVYAAR